MLVETTEKNDDDDGLAVVQKDGPTMVHERRVRAVVSNGRTRRTTASWSGVEIATTVNVN